MRGHAKGLTKYVRLCPLIHRFSSSLTFVVFYIFANKLSWLILFFLCYSLTRHEYPLEMFPYGDPPPLPTGKLGKLTPPPPGKSDPFRGVGGGEYGYFLEPHIAKFYRS